MFWRKRHAAQAERWRLESIKRCVRVYVQVEGNVWLVQRARWRSDGSFGQLLFGGMEMDELLMGDCRSGKARRFCFFPLDRNSGVVQSS
jgi:hypothetical protein